MKHLPEEIEEYRDRKWRRDGSLRIETAAEAEAFIQDLGFCLGLTDVRKRLPSLYIAVCGRRDAHMPRNVQKDPEVGAAWHLKDELVARGAVYYGKLAKGLSMFLAPRLVPAFNTVWGCSRAAERGVLFENARRVLSVLRKEWEMATADIRSACGFENKADLTKALDELQRRMKVIPQEVAYVPKFTNIWTLSEARFPDLMAAKLRREDAVLQLARAFLEAHGMTLPGELAARFALTRKEAGEANAKLVEEGFAERIDVGIYRLADG